MLTIMTLKKKMKSNIYR